VDRVAALGCLHVDPVDERALETDLRSLIRPGVGKDRLGTAVLGAVLLTGYLGGAMSQYVRLEEPYPPLVPLTTAVLAWAGLYLREGRLRALLPFRKLR
jgi:hypothetical protein